MRSLLLAGLAAVSLTASARAQVLDLTVNDVGIAIGNKPRVDGLRLNFRDRGLEQVRGINATIWTPYEPISGTVRGLALGLPITGAAEIHGLAAGVFGFGASRSMTGIGLAPIGAGVGGSMHGLLLAGVGAGVGSDAKGLVFGGVGAGVGSNFTGIGYGTLGFGVGSGMRGLAIGGLGAGVGSNSRGIVVGGLGAGVGGGSRGAVIGGLGAGIGGDFQGFGFGGLGLGAGGNATGLLVGGLGVGAGGDLRGIALSGLGIGAGGTMHGVAVALLGVGAPRIEGVAAALGVGGNQVHAIVLAPAYFRIAGEDGEFSGASLSAWNRIDGTQNGITIGLLNYARELRGFQVGLINVSDNGGKRRVTPVIGAR